MQRSSVDLDGADPAMLLSGQGTCRQTREAFEGAGCRPRRRFELQTFLPGLQCVASGMCRMIRDMITAHGYLKRGGRGLPLVVRPFRPRFSSRVSVLKPAHRLSPAPTDTSCACLAEPTDRMRRDIETRRGE